MSLDPNRVKSLFLAALERADLQERAAYLDGACAEEAELRQRVDQLLQAHREAGGADGPLPGSTSITDATIGEGPGAVIGQYKLLQQIGEGGMGVVFMAEQSRPIQRKVALKIIKPGMDSKQVLARFEQERQALALMDHPNIARVLDAGATETGRPYFVMELVKGVPVTRYCDEHKLTPRERLELFVPLCEAVQHAHTKGVIHRDLKPSNVLVALYDGKPVPKVIDFGVAKATGPRLTERTLFTEFGAVVGTLEYMSPEQAELNQLDIDTRSDVYSLGVLLYELLTGTTPLERKRLKERALLEALRLIREEDPPRPSVRLSSTEELAGIAARRGLEPRKLNSLVRGELDWIVMKALDKERGRRYATANDFAADVQRYLSDLPVEACPPSVAYRVRKFARRHKVAVGVGLVPVVSTVVLAASFAGVWSALSDRNQAYVTLDGEKTKVDRAFLAEKQAKDDLQTAQKSERHTFSIYGVSLGSREWRDGHPVQAERALEDCPAEERRWEWHHLKRLCNADLYRVQFRGEDAWDGRRGAFSPDGTRFVSATGGRSSASKVWDTRTGRELATFGGEKLPAVHRSFSPDGKWVLSYYQIQGPVIHEASTGKEVRQFTRGGYDVMPGNRRSAAFSPDSKRVALTGPSPGKRLAVYDLDTGDLVRGIDPPQGKHFGLLAYTNGGRNIALDCWEPGPERGTVKSSEVHVLDLATGETIRKLEGHRDVLVCLTADPGGTLLASGCADGSIRVWDLTTGKATQVLSGHEGAVACLRFSADGRFLASGGADATVRVWEVSTGAALVTHRGHAGEVHALTFSADGTRLTSASRDHTLRVWGVAPSRNPLALGQRADSVVLSPDGRRFATVRMEVDAGGRTVNTHLRVWETATFKELHARTIPTLRDVRLRFADGKFLAFLRKPPQGATVTDVETGEAAWEMARLSPADILSDDARRVVTRNAIGAQGGKPTTVVLDLYDARSGERLVPLGRFEQGGSAVFLPDSRQQLLLPPADRPRLLDGEGREVRALEGSTTLFSALAFSPDGHLLASGSNHPDQTGELRLWDLRTGKQLVAFDGHPQGITAVALSPDGHRLVSAGKDRTVKVWDFHTGRELITLRGNSGVVKQVTFTPDGHRVISLGEDGTVLAWDGRPWEETPGRVTEAPSGPE